MNRKILLRLCKAKKHYQKEWLKSVQNGHQNTKHLRKEYDTKCQHILGALNYPFKTV